MSYLDLSIAQWRDLKNKNLGLMNVLASSIARAETMEANMLPNLRQTETLFVLSDFGGQHKAAAYTAFCFLVVDPHSFGEWDRSWQPTRQRYLADGRRMAFKQLNDRQRRSALNPFLASANDLNGLLVCFLVHKRIKSLFRRKGRIELSESERLEFGDWRSGALEKLLVSINFIALILAGLSRPHQDIWWYTDQDEIAPNLDSLYKVCEIFARISSHYIPHQMRHFRFGTAESDDGTMRLEDLLAIPDLMAGCLTELLSCYERAELKLTSGVILPAPAKLSWKSSRLIDWFSTDGQALKRLAFSISPQGDSTNLTVQHLKFWSSNIAYV